MKRVLEWGGYKNREDLMRALFSGAAESVAVEVQEGARKGSLQVWRCQEGMFECEFHLEADEEGKGDFWGVAHVPLGEGEVREIFWALEQGVSLRSLFDRRKLKRIGGNGCSWRRILAYAIAGLLAYALYRWF